MANEFVARRGIIAQSGGAKITGSLLVSGAIDATGYNIIAASFTGSFSGSIGTATTASYVSPSGLPAGTVSSSTQVINNIQNQTISPSTIYVTTIDATTISGSTISGSFVGNGSGLTGVVAAGTVSSSGQIDVRNTTGIATIATTGSNAFLGTQNINGNLLLQNNGQIRLTSSTDSTLFGFYDGSNILGAYYQMWGNNHASTDQRGSAEFVFDTRNSGGAFHIASFDGATWVRRLTVSRDGNTNITGSLNVQGSVSASSFTGSFKGDGSQLTGVTAAGTVSASSQIDITQTTGYSTFSSSLATVDQNQQSQIDALISSTSSYALQTQLAGVASSSSQVKAYLPDGTVSASAQYPGWVKIGRAHV